MNSLRTKQSKIRNVKEGRTKQSPFNLAEFDWWVLYVPLFGRDTVSSLLIDFSLWKGSGWQMIAPLLLKFHKSWFCYALEVSLGSLAANHACSSLWDQFNLTRSGEHWSAMQLHKHWRHNCWILRWDLCSFEKSCHTIF